MYKDLQRQRFMLMLLGLVLVVACFLGGGAAVLEGKTLTASAAQVTGKTQVVDRFALQEPTSCSEEHRGPSFNSAVVVTSGEIVCSDLTSFGGSVTIRGVVIGDVVMFGGNVVINGVVNGNVTLYGGNLTVQNDAQVNGNIHVCGGMWTQGSNFQLHGNIAACTKSLGALLTSVSEPKIRLWSLLSWVLLSILLMSLLPEHVMLIGTTVKSKMSRSFMLGLLSVLLAPAILAVLVALIIAIPLAILVTVGLILAWALGTVAVGWMVGDYIVRSMFPHHCTRLLQGMVGMTALSLAGSLPSVGPWITIGSGLVGLGAVFLSRFGTRLYSPPRHPLPL